MGTSTNGQLCYGIKLEEDDELPWLGDDGDGEVDDWWRVVNGFKPSATSPFDDAGNYRPGFNTDSPEVDAWFAEQRAWDDDHPLPMELVNYCSAECPMFILAVPGSVRNAWRGDPTEITVQDMEVNDEGRQALLDFCEKHGISTANEPTWLLSSYWG